MKVLLGFCLIFTMTVVQAQSNNVEKPGKKPSGQITPVRPALPCSFILKDFKSVQDRYFRSKDEAETAAKLMAKHPLSQKYRDKYYAAKKLVDLYQSKMEKMSADDLKRKPQCMKHQTVD